ncbi:MAG: hypothetical protein H7122_09320 [Chitinophagaceae bacterium]|nr:hypothetical protein [Chitinophagaceae bacterium]
MEKDKNKPTEYPKLNENDKRWKQQDEFDSAESLKQAEDENKKASSDSSSDKDDTIKV